VAAAFLIAVTAAGSFRGWERAMYVLLVASLTAVPLAVIAWAHHVPAVPAGASAAAGAAHGGAIFLALALVGTTVAPWQPFFQQSNVPRSAPAGAGPRAPEAQPCKADLVRLALVYARG
jgi:Mn2+/Fe2+ NRAMP family transporter